MTQLLLDEPSCSKLTLGDEEETALVEIMCCAIQRAIGTNHPPGRGKPRVCISLSWSAVILISLYCVDWSSRQEAFAISEGRTEPSLYDRTTCTSNQGNAFNSMNIKRILQSGPLAQSVERGADNAKVVSSSLTRTKFFFFNWRFYVCIHYVLHSIVRMFSK